MKHFSFCILSLILFMISRDYVLANSPSCGYPMDPTDQWYDPCYPQDPAFPAEEPPAYPVISTVMLSPTAPLKPYVERPDARRYGELLGDDNWIVETPPELFSRILACRHSAYDSYRNQLWWGCNQAWLSAPPGVSPLPRLIEFQGAVYAVYPTPIPGIGYILSFKDNHGGSNNWMALRSGSDTSDIQTFPRNCGIFRSNGTVCWPVKQIGYNFRVTFVKTTSHLLAGDYAIPPFTLAIVKAWNKKYNAYAIAEVRMSAITFNVQTIGCTITSGKNYQLPLIPVTDREIVNNGTGPKAITPVDVAISCSKGINLFATATDLNDPQNRSTVVTLTRDSTAYGVGVQFFRSGDSKPLIMGPNDSSAFTDNQFFIKTFYQDDLLVMTFDAGYVRTKKIVLPGTVKSLVGITFSYQ